MKERLNIGVLVTARDEYMSYLKKQLSPHILDGLVSIYNDAVDTQEKLNSYKYNKQFQIFLKAIPQWNQTVLITETKRILDIVDYLQKLVTAIFMSEIKILTSIRLGGDGKNIEIRVTPTDLLIHRIYINVAKVIYNSVELLESFSDIKNEQYKLRILIENIIEETVIELIPIKKILDEYLTTVLTDISRECESDSDSDTEHETKDILENNFGSVNDTPNDSAVVHEFDNQQTQTPSETIESIENLIDTTINDNNALLNQYDNVTPADHDAPKIRIGETGNSFGSFFGFGTDNTENVDNADSDSYPISETTETLVDTNNPFINAVKELEKPSNDFSNSFGTENAENRFENLFGTEHIEHIEQQTQQPQQTEQIDQTPEYTLPDISTSEAPADSFF